MITTNPYSWWGIKNTGDDISEYMMDIVKNANQFIVVGGYNFTFRDSAAARPFFEALTQRVRDGIKVLMLFPPNLHARFNPQPRIIRYCFGNGIAVILNHQNHSKWLLTDVQMYYGSSNFTTSSWKDKVEVISLHDHADLPNKRWALDTIQDFNQFLQDEVRDFSNRRRMLDYPGLLANTIGVWGGLQPLILRLNPSIEKVKSTLSNYDKIQGTLREQVSYWFHNFNDELFSTVLRLSYDISSAVDRVCEYGYGNIYNETVEKDDIDLRLGVINTYNKLVAGAHQAINDSIKILSSTEIDGLYPSQVSTANFNRITEYQSIIYNRLGGYGRG